MGNITLGSNIASIRAQRLLNENSSALSDVFARLSSGLRINRASDDAAGLAISSSLNKDSRVYGQAIRNGNDAISALNIADGTLSELSSVVFRLKELATQASSGTFGRTQRISMDQEAGALTNEFNRLVGSTDFNGFKLLNGELTYVGIQLGYGALGSIGIGLGSGLSRKAGTGGFTDSGFALNFSGVAGSGVLNDSRTGDFNGDGYDDLIFSTATVVSISLSNGDGTFAAPVTAVNVSSISSIQAADFNGDGKLDLMTSALSNGNITIALGNGNGTFQGSTTLTSGVAPANYARVGDINGDGKIDIAATGASGGLAILIGNGDGTFKSAIINTYGTPASGLTLADINNDGKLDATISNGVLYGNGDGTFRTVVTVSGVSNSARFADVNRDGYVDSLIASGTNLNVRLGNGDGTFRAATSFATGVSGTALYGDYNNDGIMDAMIYAGSTSVLFGNGDGTFSSAVSSTLTDGGSTLASGDFNGDGVLDFVSGATGSTDLLVFLQNSQNTTTTQRFDLTTITSARQALDYMDILMGRIVKERGIIGAAMSRVSFALNNLASLRENSIAASGRIQNADIAADTAEMTRRQILQQSASAVLAQANQQPALALTLLRQ